MDVSKEVAEVVGLLDTSDVPDELVAVLANIVEYSEKLEVGLLEVLAK